MKTQKTSLRFWPVVLLAIRLGSALSRADNPPIEPPCTPGTTYGSWFCWGPGAPTGNAHLTFTNLTVQVGELIIPLVATGTASTNGSKARSVITTDCASSYELTYEIAPLKYIFDKVTFDPPLPSVFWTPGTNEYAASVRVRDAEDLCPPFVIDLGTLTLVVGSNTATLINVDFGSTNAPKRGIAAVGNTSFDVWNRYTPSGADADVLTNLLTSEGFASPVKLTVAERLIVATNDSPDRMYHEYVADPGQDFVTLRLAEVPAGTWSLYLYGQDASFDLSIGTNDYGIQTTYDVPLSSPLVWEAGRQYVVFTNIAVKEGDALIISLIPGESTPAMIAGLQLCSPRSAPPVSVPVVPDIIGWWKGEQNAYDSIGTNNGTTPFGMAYAPGEVGDAFDFDGTSRRVSIPDSPDFKLTTALTVEGWIFPRAYGGIVVVRGDNRAGLDPWKVDLNTTGSIHFQITDATNGVGEVFASIATNQWQHIAATFDSGTGKLRLYVNGQVAAEGTTPLRPFSDLDAAQMPAVGIGNAGGTTQQAPFNGSIDELSLYSRALDADEIEMIYRSGSAGKHLPSPLPGIVAPSGLVSWWPAENNASDLTGQNNGQLMNGTAFGVGKVGRAFSLDGTNDYVKVPKSASLDVSQVTVEFWMKANPSNSMNTYQGLVTSDFYGVEIANGWSLGPKGLSFFVSTDGGATVSPGSFRNTADANGGGAVVTPGEWHHVAGTYDGTKLQLYVDGAAWGNPLTHSGSISPMLANSFLTIGAEDGRTTWPQYIGPRYFQGLIDEPAIYNRALSAAEIKAIYDSGRAGKKLEADSDYDGISDAQEWVDRTDPADPASVRGRRLGYWRFDNTNTWVGDAGQLPVVATTNLSGVDSWSGHALNVDSTNAAILQYRATETNGSANINFRTGTIRFWFKPDFLTNNGPGRLLLKTKDVAAYPGESWALSMSSDGTQVTLSTGIRNAQNQLLLKAYQCTNAGLRSNVWHQLVVTYSPGGEAVYVDGTLKASGTESLYYPRWQVRSQGFFVGSDYAGNSQAMGTFEELETFNYVLSSNTIAAQYAAVAAADGTGNGLPDIWEWNHFRVFYQLADADPDKDDLPNLQEYLAGTDPADCDTDYDGRNDGEELAENTNPLDPNSFLPVALATWHFDDTNSWLGADGQVPMGFSNIQGVTNWSGSALQVDSTSASYLKYRTLEQKSHANINLRNGTLRFWFKPGWDSTTLGGTGPGSDARLIEIGEWFADAHYGNWGMRLNPGGTQLLFRLQSDGQEIIPFQFPIQWTSNVWHQLVVTYAPTGSALYIDGTLATTGLPFSIYPNANVRSTGLMIGSNSTGGNQARGRYDEIETFNYPLSSQEISAGYAAVRLAAPSIVLDNPPGAPSAQLSVQQLGATEILSTVSGDSHPDTFALSLVSDYSDSFFARGPYHFDSSSFGVNVTRLPAVNMDPAGATLSSPTNVTLSLGSENLSDMVAGIFRTELGRTGQGAEVPSWISYAQGLRSSGQSDENIRSNLVNSFRQLSEYTAKYPVAGDLYVGNTNYTIEYSLDAGNTWTPYSGAISIFSSVNLRARVRKPTTYDNRTVYGYLTSDPTSATFSYTQSRLGFWPFDTTAWTGADGQAPLSQSGLSAALVTGIQTNAVDLIGTDGSKVLSYRYAEANGALNINLKAGTVRFWFKPNWASLSQGGGGLSTDGRLINLGEWTANASSGAWQILFKSSGDQIGIRAQNNTGSSAEPLYVDVPNGIKANQWRQIAVAYTPSSTAIYVDGALAGVGPGLNSLVPPSAVLNQGFFVGSDTTGAKRSQGVFDSLETFNYALTAGQIQSDYRQFMNLYGPSGSGGGGPITTIENPANGSRFFY